MAEREPAGATAASQRPEERRAVPPLAVLLASLREQIPRLVRGERALIAAELSERRTNLSTGGVMLVVMLVLGFFGFAVLVTAAVVAIALALPAWLSALLIAAALIIVAVILALLGLAMIKRVDDDAH
jgi:uncharacterized membrane protein YqjE